MELGRIATNSNELLHGFVVESFVSSTVRSHVEDVEEHDVGRQLRPQGIESVGRGGVVRGEDLAESKKIVSLRGVGIIAHDGFEVRDGFAVVLPTEFHKSNIQTNTRGLRGEPLRFLQISEGRVPVLAAHGDNAEVGIGSAGVGISGENLTESFFSGVEISRLQGGLALLKPSLRIGNTCGLFGLRSGKRRGQ